MLTKQEFDRAAEQYLDMVYRIALNYFRHPQDAEDIAQEMMLRLWREEGAFGSDAHLRYWLVRVTLNLCRDHARSAWHRRTIPLVSCPEPSFSTPERSALYQAVMGLPAKYRLPLYLYYYEGYSVTEVGELLRLNPSTVQTRLARARAKLKQELEE